MTTAQADGDIVLRTTGLTKAYGKRLAVDGLDLTVPRGRVFGFLGPNGAGKTTTIGMALGLIAPTAGHVELFGMDTRTHLSDALRRTGAMLEAQSYFPHLSARDNLRVWATAGGIEKKRIEEVLDLVGLRERARDKMRNYSQGMKQRLAVAAALLHEPQMVILDEPTNGLDPAGIREFRELMRELARGGMTVFVSSHLLSEVEQMCDDVAIVKEGRLLAQGPVATLKRGATAVEMRVTDATRAVPVLEALPWVTDVTRDGDGRLLVTAPPDRSAELSRALAEQQIYLHELRARDSSLEDFFLEVTGDGAAHG